MNKAKLFAVVVPCLLVGASCAHKDKPSGGGARDQSAGAARLETFTFTDLPVLATTAAGEPITLGGFSGLVFEGVNSSNGRLMFTTHGDRGPNPEPKDLDGDGVAERPFALPDYQAQWVKFELDRKSGKVELTGRVKLTREDGRTPITGLPNIPTATGLANSDERGVDLFGKRLAADPNGADLESLAKADDGSYWMGDEYRPAILHFSKDGRLIQRYVPQGAAAAAAGQPAGTFGDEALPAVFAQRRSNRGFEAIAFQGGKVYAFIQSPIDNPDTKDDAASKASRVNRILELDPATKKTRQFAYVLEGGASDKIGDATSVGGGRFLLIERDDATGKDAQKKVFEIDVTRATDLSGFAPSGKFAGKTVEQIHPKDLAEAGVTPVSKRLKVDLIAAGYDKVGKAEGLTIVDERTIAVINDNDYRMQGGFDPKTGKLTPNPKPEPEILGVITLPR